MILLLFILFSSQKSQSCWLSSVWWQSSLSQIRRRSPCHPQSSRQVPHLCLREHPWGIFSDQLQKSSIWWALFPQVESVAALEEIISDPDSMRMQVETRLAAMQTWLFYENNNRIQTITFRPCWYASESWAQRTRTPATTSGIGAPSMPTWGTSSDASPCGCKRTYTLLYE